MSHSSSARAPAGPTAAGSVRALALAGTSGPGTALPHLERIQPLFGAHDLSGVVAHTGPRAAAAAQALGAEAFTFGEHIAFSRPPTPDVAAHEAAHVVQQRAGVSVPGGLGRAGDVHERGAEAVARAVGLGRSAAPLLGPAAAGGGAAVQRLRREDGVVQRKLQAWANPQVKNPADAEIVAAKAEVDGAAAAINTGVEAGAQRVRDLVGVWKAGELSVDEVMVELSKHVASKRHVRNFGNKLIDWGKKGSATARAAAVREAGYVIEGFADAAAKKAGGIETQVVLDGSRPDFRHKTAHTYEQDGETHTAHGLIDATSAAEAASGHILAKVNVMSAANARNHPILYDCYYDDLGFAGGVLAVDMSGAAVAAREKHYVEQAQQAKRRKKSLRSAKSSADLAQPAKEGAVKIKSFL